MNVRHISLGLAAATMGALFVGCGAEEASASRTADRASDRGADYGWFTYAAPDGWARHEPPPGITYGPMHVEFRPEVVDPQNFDRSRTTRLEIREVTDLQSRTERIPTLYARMQENIWRSRCADAEAQGNPMPAFESETIASPIGGPGKKEGFAFLSERDGKKLHTMIFFVETADRRYFRADYTGIDPEFSTHRDAIVASLRTIAFTAPASTTPASREQTVAFFREQLDDERLWLYDGAVAGQRLNDTHLEALTDPALAEIEDLNLVAGPAAMSSGVDVTDAGLAHIKHLPLRSLCLRGSLVTDAGLEHLKDLPLESLVLEGTLIEGDGLRHLAGLKLKVIDLANTPVDDDDLKHLFGMPLITVDLRNTPVTDAGLAELQKQLPKLVVSR